MLPSKAKSVSEFESIPEKLNGTSGHHVNIVAKPYYGKDKPTTFWYKKKYVANEVELAEYEAAISEVYRTLIGDLAPKVRAIYDHEGQILYSVSKKLTDFTPLVDYTGNLEDLLEYGLPEILVASYFSAEDDLHKANFGKNGRIDFDMSCWPITYRIKQQRPYSQILGKYPWLSFKFTERDLLNLPHIEDTWAFYWPTNLIGLSQLNELLRGQTGDFEKQLSVNPLVKPQMYTKADQLAFKALSANPRFIEKKFLSLLKILLIPSAHFTAVSRAYLKNPLSQSDLAGFFQQRQQLLMHELLRMPAFYQFLLKIIENKMQALKILIAEFEDYNRSLKPTKDKELFIPTSDLESTFYLIWRDSHQHQIALNLFRLKQITEEVLPSKNLEAHTALETLYQALISSDTVFFKDSPPSLSTIKQHGQRQLSQLEKAKVTLNKKALSPENLKQEWETVYYELKVSYTRLACKKLSSITQLTKTAQQKHDSATHSYEARQHLKITKASVQQLILGFTPTILEWLLDTTHSEALQFIIQTSTRTYLNESPTQSTSSASTESHTFLPLLSRSFSTFKNLVPSVLSVPSLTRTKIEKATQLLEKSEQFSGLPGEQHTLVKLMLQPLLTGNWKSTSLNTQLMKNLLHLLKDDFRNKFALEQMAISPELYHFFNLVERQVLVLDELSPIIGQILAETFESQELSHSASAKPSTSFTYR